MSQATSSHPQDNHKINYIEFTTPDVERTKKFYTAAFGWSFEDWGPEYTSFNGAGIDGGFMAGVVKAGGPLVILYAEDIAATEKAVIEAGGSVTVPVFEFPGGRRFHFADGAGNELAVWSE